MNVPVTVVIVVMIMIVQTVIYTIFVVIVLAGNNPQYDNRRLFKAKGSTLRSHCGTGSSLSFFIAFMCLFTSLRVLSPPNRRVASTPINEELTIILSQF
jgi:hypothetical protein